MHNLDFGISTPGHLHQPFARGSGPEDPVGEGVFVEGVVHALLIAAGVVCIEGCGCTQEAVGRGELSGLASRRTPAKAAFRAASTAFSAASPGVDGVLPPLRISRAIS